MSSLPSDLYSGYQICEPAPFSGAAWIVARHNGSAPALDTPFIRLNYT